MRQRNIVQRVRIYKKPKNEEITWGRIALMPVKFVLGCYLWYYSIETISRKYW